MNAAPAPIREELREAAALMAHRSRLGIPIYPLATLLLGLTALPAVPTVLLGGAVAASVAASVVRAILVLRLDSLLARSPRHWFAAYAASLLVVVLAWSALAAAIVVAVGVDQRTILAISTTVVFSGLSIIVYAPFRRLSAAVQLALSVPCVAALVAFVSHPAIWLTVALYYLYLAIEGRRLSREFWQALANRRQFETRSSELAAALERQRRAEEALSERAAMLRAVVDSSSSPIFVKDGGGRYTLINAAGADIIGRPIDEILGRTDLEVFGAEIGAEIQEQDRRVAETGTLIYERTRLYGGRRRTLHTTKAVFPLPDGSRGIVGVSADITARKLAEDRLADLNATLEERVVERTRRLEALARDYRLLFESAADAVLVVGAADGRILDANRRAAELLRARPGSLVDRSLSDLLVDRPPAAEIERILADRAGGEGTLDLSTDDGEIIHAEPAASPVEVGGRGAILVLLRDITDRLRRDAEIRLRQRRYRELFDAFDMGIVLCDRDGRIEDANPAARRIFAIANGAPLPAGLSDLLPDEAAERIRRRLGDAGVEGDGGAPFEIERTTAAGRGRIEVAIGLATTDRDRIWQLRFRDITAAEMRRRQIEETERMAAYGSLIAGVAHEVRNPVFAIEMASEVIANRAAGDDVIGRHARIVVRSAARVRALMDDLLEYARPRALALSRIAPADLLQAVAETCAVETTGGPPALHLRPANGLPPIRLDAQKILQVLVNLCDNARRHAAGATLITVGARAADDGELAGRPAIAFEVVDDGCGIPAENLGRLFDPFFSTRAGGTGLGLSIVRRIVEDHGGRIHVASEPGRGATFSVVLPITGPPDDGTAVADADGVALV